MVWGMTQHGKDKHKMNKENSYQCRGIESLEQGTLAKGQDLQRVTWKPSG